MNQWERLSDDGDEKKIVVSGESWRFFLEQDSLSKEQEWIPYLPKPGKFQHGKYGQISISRERNSQFVSNFNSGVYQQQIPVDAEHETKVSGALGWLMEMRVNDDGSADARVSWTERGKKMLSDKRFRYVSPEFYETWTDPATGNIHKDVAIGAALTTRPFFKENSMRPLIASEDGIKTPELPEEEVDASIPVTNGEFSMQKETENEVLTQLQQRFDEIEAALSESQQRSQQLTEALDESNRKIAEMQKKEKIRRFSDMIESGNRWFGETEKHLRILDSLAEIFGENSQEFSDYVEQQQSIAEQAATSALFAEYGHNRSGGKQTASEQVDALARQIQQESKGNLTYQQAYSEALTQRPDLYAQHLKGE